MKTYAVKPEFVRISKETVLKQNNHILDIRMYSPLLKARTWSYEIQASSFIIVVLS
jgi:hypothetical protein